jgi:hypothetical protein
MLGVLLLTGTALADPVVGAIPPGGWGTDCSNWIEYTDPWVSNHLIYDPLLGAGGEGFRDCVTNAAVIWPGLEIEMWVEMECLLTWNATHVKIHRASDYDGFFLYFYGTSACNNGQWIITTPPTAVGGLEYLPFVKDMFNRTGPAYGTDIPLTWEYNIDGGGFAPMIAGTDGNLQFEVGLCDHSFTIRIFVDQQYHQEDGYYYLGGPGASICPTTPL